MRRHVGLLLLVGLVAATTPAAGAARIKAKAPAEATFFVVPDGEGCGLSTDRQKGYRESHRCKGDVSGVGPASTPIEMRALDGTPLTLDSSKVVRGTLLVESRYLVGYFGTLGAGQSQIEVSLTARSGGKDVLVGETVTDPYLVTPLTVEYEVPFEITPDAGLGRIRLDSLTMTVTLVGTTVEHGLFPTSSASQVTLPLAR